MITINNISKGFQTTRHQYSEILKDISFTIHPGEITGLIGLNGAGKTTLIRTIAGLYTPNKGSIDFIIDSQTTKKNISVLSSEHRLYGTLSVKKNINYFGILSDPDFDIDHPDTQQMIKFLQIHDVYDKPIEKLSSGWRQKILILLAFLHKPQLLLLDEPSSYLDFLGQRQLDSLIQLAKNAGKCILYASHKLHDIQTKCDNIILLHEGRLLMNEKRENIADLEAEILKIVSEDNHRPVSDIL